MSKIIARIKGGLGNQLFCYAAARRLALVNGAELVIDDVTGFARDREYRRRYLLEHFQIPCRKASPDERMEPFERYRRGLTKFIARHRSFYKRQYLEQEGIDFDPRLLDFKVKETLYLDGLWQSENYFKDVEEQIRHDLQIIPPLDVRNQEFSKRIRNCNAVCVHVRWFEMQNSNGHNASYNLNRDYYLRAIEKIFNKVPDFQLFLFSDDTEKACKMLQLHVGKINCVDHNHDVENTYADLWLMTQCKYFIIANSTFSWWGAWLSRAPDKIVIAPVIILEGITAWGFKGLIPDGWILL